MHGRELHHLPRTKAADLYPATMSGDQDEVTPTDEVDEFVSTYRAPTAFYKLVEQRWKKRPLFLARTLSYRSSTRKHIWVRPGSTQQLNTNCKLPNVLQTTVRRTRLKPLFATLYIEGFSESISSTKGKLQNIPITVGLYEAHDANQDATASNRNSPKKNLKYYTLLESHAMLVPYKPAGATISAGTGSPGRMKAAPASALSQKLELSMDIAKYVDIGRRLFVVIHIYNPHVTSDPFFFGVSQVASQVTLPPIDKRYRIVASTAMSYRTDGGSTDEEEGSVDESNATPRKRRRTEGTGQVRSATRKRKRRAARNTEAGKRNINESLKSASDSAIILRQQSRPTRRLQEAMDARNTGSHPPMAAFHAQFDILAGASGRQPLSGKLRAIKRGSYQRPCFPTDNNSARQNHPLKEPTLHLRLEWEHESKHIRTLKGAGTSGHSADRYRRVCQGVELNRRLSGIPPLCESKPNVAFHYQFYRKKEKEGGGYEVFSRSEVREDFCCPWCQVYCADLASLVCHLTCSHSHYNFECKGTPNQPEICVKVLPQSLNEKTDSPTGNYFFSKSLSRIRQIRDAHSQRKTNSPDVASAASIGADAHSNEARPDLLQLLRGNSTQQANGAKRKATAGKTVDNVGFAESSFLGLPNVRKDVSTTNTRVSNEDDDFKAYRETAHLHFRRYYHSKTCQPMQYPMLQSDSDDDVDEEWILEQGEKLLDEFEDVSKEEKMFMKMWNRFIFYNKIRADFEVHQRCIDFAKAKGEEIVKKNLRENFLLHLINMWDFALVRSNTMVECMLIVDNSDTTDVLSNALSSNHAQSTRLRAAQEKRSNEFQPKKQLSDAVAKRIATMRKRIGTVKSDVLTVSNDLEVQDYEKLKKSLNLVDVPKPDTNETEETTD